MLPPWTAVAALLFAFALDRCFGEPPARGHPVVWMGRYLTELGRRIAPRESSAGTQWPRFWLGALAWCGGAVPVALIAWLLQTHLMRLAGSLDGPPPGSGLVACLVAGLVLGGLLKPTLSWRMLQREVMAVEAALAQSLDAGRLRLGHLVSRAVTGLSETEVRESAVESLAENFNDSVVAPVFWFIVAGLPGAALYRFANTADAMWGYRGHRAGAEWEWAGKWAARADDVLSWLPARIAALLLAVAARGLPLARLQREAARTPSPNSGWPMAAMALALDVRLRKAGVYVLNQEGQSAAPADTHRAVALARRAISALLVCSCAMLLALAVIPW